MVVAEFSIFPLDKGESLSTYVARAIGVIDKSGLPYRLGPMGTTIEGEWDEVMGVIKRCYQAMHEDCKRIECAIKIDACNGPGGQMGRKIESVEKRLGRKIKT